MPHSSGGGSRSSGSFSGSSSSYSSGSHSSGTTVRTPRVASQYSEGYHRYVYYHDHKTEYFYSDEPITRKDTRISPFSLIFRLLLVFLGLSVVYIFVKSWIHIPEKLSLDYAQTEVQIFDSAGILSTEDETLLSRTFRQFQDVTGITPGILTVRPEDWQSNYSDFSAFAFESYVTRYRDESHWLFCYSGNSDADFDNWTWEGMQGNDTDLVLTPSITDRFTDTVQKYLYARNQYTVGEAFSQGLQDILPGIMDTSFSPDPEDGLYVILYSVILILAPVWVTIRQIRRVSKLKGKEDAVRCPTDRGEVEEDTCAYCGGLYVHGIHFSCPHCGAPVPPSDAS